MGASADRHETDSPGRRLILAPLSGAYTAAEMNHTASEPALIQEFELRTDALRQCALAATRMGARLSAAFARRQAVRY